MLGNEYRKRKYIRRIEKATIMDILNLKSTFIAIVRFNEVPFNKLIQRSFGELIIKSYNFTSVEAIQDAANDNIIALKFRNGLFQSDDVEVIINNLQIEERKIHFSLDSSSDIAYKFFQNLTEFLANIKKTTVENYLTPILISYESEIITKLKFPMEKLVSPIFVEFMRNDVVREASSEIANSFVRPAVINFEIDYLVNDSTLSDYRVALSRKDFVLGPARGYPVEEQIYYSKAPFETETHMRLLQKLEEEI